MPAIKSAADIAEKWGRVTPTRDTDYRTGIDRPMKDWQTEAAAAEDRYENGVQQAINEKRFGKGVNRAGTDKWQRKAREVGVNRWGPGVRAAQPDYEQGFGPYRDVIERVDLPPRRATGDPTNIDRVAAIASALHEAKTGGGGA